jgi:chromate transporter
MDRSKIMSVQPLKSDSVSEVSCRPSLFLLFASFLRLGVSAFGGPAMIAYIRKRVVAENKWLDPVSFQDGVALCQAIPGATVMQMAAYVGLKLRGVRGAIISFVGFGLPAFLLMLGLSAAYSRTHELPAVVSIFSGLQAVIVAIVANATVSFGRTSLKNRRDGFIALVAAGLFGLMVNPVFIVALSAMLGMLLIREPAPARSGAQTGSMMPTTLPILIFLLVSGAGLTVLFALRPEMFQLAIIMSKIDLLAFGGAFGSVPLMFHEIVEARSWMDAPTFLNGIVLGQFTPGPIVITATFVGYLLYSIPGAIVATLSIFTPSFLILIGITPWFDRLRSSPWFNRAIRGILCSFVGLLFTVTLRFAWNVHWDWPHMAVGAGAFTALLFKADLLWVVLAGAGISALAL